MLVWTVFLDFLLQLARRDGILFFYLRQFAVPVWFIPSRFLSGGSSDMATQTCKLHLCRLQTIVVHVACSLRRCHDHVRRARAYLEPSSA